MLPFRYELETDQLHPLSNLNVNPNCESCEFGQGCAIGGAGPDELKNIKLIVISDYPGGYEKKAKYPFWDNDRARQPKLNRRTGFKSILKFKNGGSILREYLHELFDLDTYREVWTTYALKCDPGDTKAQEKHLRLCAQSWLIKEISLIDFVCPTIPILVAGQHAYKSLKLVSKGTELPSSLKKGLRSTRYKMGGHPLIFTFNPNIFARSVARYEEGITITPSGHVIPRTVIETEPLIGSPAWQFKNHLLLLKPYIESE